MFDACNLKAWFNELSVFFLTIALDSTSVTDSFLATPQASKIGAQKVFGANV
jgi:hypothetical protein